MSRIAGLISAVALAYFAASPCLAADGKAILERQCAQCHALSKPADTSLERLRTRKGPDLYYAGVKYQRQWLVEWLEQPTRTRPAGEFYFEHIRMTSEGDVVNVESLPPHPKLSAADAAAVSDALMGLKGPEGLVKKDAFKKQAVPAMIGAMMFEKLRGCAACHMDKPGSGGLSGPELYDAGLRLQPDYVYAYIADPQRFDPHIWMPALQLSEADLERLTGYLMSLKETPRK